MIYFLQKIGQKFITFNKNIGKFAIFNYLSIKSLFSRPIYFKIIGYQIFQIGYLSLPVIGFTAIFTGAVLALQSYNGFSRFNAESSIPIVVILSITRELGPVLSGLMIAARVGSSIAAEIGTMKVTEQIDALKTLSIDVYKYIITPRILAGILTMPFLVIIADIIGVLGGYLVSVHYLHFASGVYLKNTFQYLSFSDINCGLIKALVFGFIITSISCFNGYNAQGGAHEVGKVTINSVVFSSIMILLMNYFITSLLF